MTLMAIVFLYFVCLFLIRGVFLAVFAGKNPSDKTIGIITLLSIFWPVWSEFAIVAFCGFAIVKFVTFCRDNQNISA